MSQRCLIVDAGFVPDEHDLAALGGTVAKLIGTAALDDGDVMGLFLAVFRIGHAEAAHVVGAHVVGAHVHAEEVPGGRGAEFAFGVVAFLIEGSGVVVMAVHGVEVPVIEFLALGERIGDALLHRLGEQVVEGGDIGESARAFEGFEKWLGSMLAIPWSA